MKRRNYIIALILIIALPLTGYGIKYYNATRPEVSGEQAVSDLMAYKEALEAGYGSLEEAFADYREDPDNEAWMAFSREWFVDLGEAKPEDADKRYPRELEPKKEALLAVDGRILELWKEYNGNFTKGAVDGEAVEHNKMIIEGVFEKLIIE